MLAVLLRKEYQLMVEKTLPAVLLRKEYRMMVEKPLPAAPLQTLC